MTTRQELKGKLAMAQAEIQWQKNLNEQIRHHKTNKKKPRWNFSSLDQETDAVNHYAFHVFNHDPIYVDNYSTDQLPEPDPPKIQAPHRAGIVKQKPRYEFQPSAISYSYQDSQIVPASSQASTRLNTSQQMSKPRSSVLNYRPEPYDFDTTLDHFIDQIDEFGRF